MKKIFKILTVFIILAIQANACFAIEIGKIEKLIKKSGLNDMSIVSVSIKNAENNNIVYELNSKRLLHPASTIKLFTQFSAINTLGYDYFFRTGFYKDSQNNLYIKLGADPLLTVSQLKQAMQKVKETGASYNNLYFDDSIIDKKECSPGWMWDDNVNPYTPKVSAYNLDKNVIKLNIEKNSEGNANLSLSPAYPMSIISDIKIGIKKDMLEVNSYYWNNPEVVEIYGAVTNPKSIYLPLSSMRRYFIYNLDKITDDLRIEIKSTSYSSKLVPSGAELITEIANPILPAAKEALESSSNLSAETIYKLAGANKYSSTGSDTNAFDVFNEFYKSIGMNMDNIKLSDGCGVSRYDLIYADWMTEALNKLYKMKNFEKFKELLAQPGEGTLSKRLFDLRGDTWLKTGSLNNISTITGYVKSQDGHVYSIAILTENYTKNNSDVKAFEDELIKLIYNR